VSVSPEVLVKLPNRLHDVAHVVGRDRKTSANLALHNRGAQLGHPLEHMWKGMKKSWKIREEDMKIMGPSPHSRAHRRK
jgi:hypothetical protein